MMSDLQKLRFVKAVLVWAKKVTADFRVRTKILRAFGGMMAGPLVATCLGTPSNGITLKTAVHLVNCTVN